MCRCFADHPRVCVEHHVGRSGGWMVSGSSPRLRGALVLVGFQFEFPRIIPASAGSTFDEAFNLSQSSDHPRVCGEHDSMAVGCVYVNGSSPRLRGAHPQWEACHLKLRIIPASAGSTDWGNNRIRKITDHPRVCGEHLAQPRLRVQERGSSPRLRGARTCGDIQRLF